MIIGGGKSMRKQFNLLEVKLKMQIDKAYIDYQKFMKTSHMPSYRFIYTSQKGTTIAEMRYDRKQYNLIVADTLETNHKEEVRAVLYHEFTHLYDEENFVKEYGFSHDDRNTPYVYKELHAEQVKTLFLLGCKTIDDVENIDIDSKTFFLNGKMYNIFDYLMMYKKEFANIIDQIEKAITDKKKINMYEFNNYLNRIFYYIGTVSVYIKFCNKKEFDELDINQVYDYFGFGLESLLDELLKNPIGCHTEEMIKKMGKIRTDIIVHFGTELNVIDYK
jgi:hypothetical protein